MTTYNTYAEAKIANPDSEIYKHVQEGYFATREYVEKFLDWKNWDWWVKCHPKDHCMSVADFIDSGYKYVDGDVYLGVDGRVYTVGVHYSPDFANTNDINDGRRYILRAKSLETQSAKIEIDNTAQQVDSLSSAATTKGADNGVTKVPTKVEYVKVEYNHIWEIMKMQSEGVDFYIKTDATKSGYGLVQNNPTSLLVASSDDLYRLIEKEVDWRDIVKQDFAVWFDEGKVGMKMAFSEENYLEMCRVTLRAIGEIE